LNVDGQAYRTIWLDADGESVWIIDQARLPHEFVTLQLTSVEDAAEAIRSMQVRGAPLIGATAAYGLCLQLREDASDAAIARASELLASTRPTAINLKWALDEMEAELKLHPPEQRVAIGYQKAGEIADDDVESCRKIGENGVGFIGQAFEKAGGREPVQILTHCNAGWLATVDWGMALSPIYTTHDRGLPVHVWVDETRPATGLP